MRDQTFHEWINTNNGTESLNKAPIWLVLSKVQIYQELLLYFLRPFYQHSDKNIYFLILSKAVLIEDTKKIYPPIYIIGQKVSFLTV